MCGICGFSWDDSVLVRKMANTISHRGPDQDGFFNDNFISLGHKRLSIIDLSSKSRQPMCNEEGDVWLVFNGEIYNYREIRDILRNKGHVFSSDSDSEVIVHAYEEYGFKCVDFLNGMFSFAIWDSRKKIIFMARDRLGIKPLFYYFNSVDKKIVFASEMKAILADDSIKRKLSVSGFNQIVDFAYSVDGKTLIDNINELLPGHTLVFDYDKIYINRFWDVNFEIKDFSEDYFVKKLEVELEGAVKKRLVSDVPLGASLSGGLDSSAVVALMNKVSDNPVKTFTIAFNDESDEVNEAKIVADYCSTDHHEIYVDFKDLTKSIPSILWHAETPFARPSFFSGYFLSKGINKNGVTVDLAGSGGDEIFAGYNRYSVFLEKNKNNFSLEQKADKITSNYFHSEAEKKKFFENSLLSSADLSQKPKSVFLPYLKKFSDKEHINAALSFELKSELQGVQLWRDDRMSMAHSHEVRVPLLDHNLVELAMSIPSKFKWSGDNKKQIFQKSVKNILPKETVYRKKKPFGMPLARFFKEDFIDVADSVLSKGSFLKNDYVKQRQVLSLLNKIKKNEVVTDNSLRQILFFTNFELFKKLFLNDSLPRKTDISLHNLI